LERIVLYASLPVVTFYPIGAFHYCLQLMVHYGLDEHGAMYAVILVSREYVIGQVIWAFTFSLRRLFPTVIPAILINFITTLLYAGGL
jgi:hypothetical protein